MRKLNTENKLRIRATPLTAIIYNNEFGSDLTADWGLVEHKTLKFWEARITLGALQNEYSKLLKELGFDEDTEEAREKVLKEKPETVSVIITSIEAASKNYYENMDLELTLFMQILYAMNVAQLRKEDKESDEQPFDKWVIANDDIQLLAVWKDVAEEIENLFSDRREEIVKPENQTAALES